MKRVSNIAALVLILASFGVLVPGIIKPVLTIDGSITLPLVGTMNLGSETRSIMGTIEYLFETKNYLVATLILVFSVVVPIIKGLLLLVSLLPGQARFKVFLLKIVRRIGKWSMADVFVVAVFLAYLATASMQVFKARLEVGFYYFLTYCILSLVSTEFIILTSDKTSKSNP